MAYTETWSGKINRKLIKKLHIIDVAAGRCKADLVLETGFSGMPDALKDEGLKTSVSICRHLISLYQ